MEEGDGAETCTITWASQTENMNKNKVTVAQMKTERERSCFVVLPKGLWGRSGRKKADGGILQWNYGSTGGTVGALEGPKDGRFASLMWVCVCV